jgi:ribosomal protein S18 acetylase RimI-like enzyme
VIRAATTDDLEPLLALWRDFEREVPDPDYDRADIDVNLREIEDCVSDREKLALIDERDGEIVGFALALRASDEVGLLTDLYVRPAARRSGVARALVHEVVRLFREQGVQILRLEVLASNRDAQAIYQRWGFRPEQLTLVADVEALEQRVAERAPGPSFGSVHLQTDDRALVERAVAKALPRLGRSDGTEISEARNGWIAVYDELSDRDPKTLRRLARELSLATGAPAVAIGIEQGEVVRYALYDRGGVVDEYLSVPEYYGPLPPGDVIALGANPTVVARLTGAEPAAIRSIAVTGASPAELAPAEEILHALAQAMGLEGADHGYGAA